MSHLWTRPPPVGVELARDGSLLAFRWRGERHPVGQELARWRVDQGWWAHHRWREYVRLVTTTGLAVELFCDLATGTWHLQRLFD